MELRPRDAVAAVDVTGRSVAPRLCTLSLSAGDQYRRRICCPWFHFFGIISYLLIIVEGATSGSFPYQTPVSHALLHLGHSALSLIP